MSKRDRLSGNEAVANAIRQINPDVIAAFPITPSTEIPQYVSLFKAEGKIDTEFVTVESEHSAISATAGAEAAGVRAMTATSSAGFALMHEMRPHQHQQRPLGLHGLPGLRLDADLQRERPGGL